LRFIALFFIWPCVPDATISSIRVIEPISLEQTPKGDWIYSLEGKWEIDFAFDNGNFVSWSFQAVYKVYVNQPTLDTMIDGSIIPSLQPPRGHSITTIPIHIYHSSEEADDPVFVGLTKSCSSGRPVRILVDFSIYMPALEFVKESKKLETFYTCEAIQ
jgi:hypothetical protein